MENHEKIMITKMIFVILFLIGDDDAVKRLGNIHNRIAKGNL